MSENNTNVPKIRFPGFTDTWEQRKLSEVMSDFIVPMRDKPKEFSGDIPWTRIEDIEGKYLNGSLSGQYVSEETIKKMNLKIIPKGSLIVSASATFGVVAVVTKDLITNQTFIGLVPEREFDLDFLYTFFQSPTVQKKMKLESAGSTIFYISRQTFEDMKFSFPVYAEQQKVGKFFSNLDHLITLHQRKLNNLQDEKKSLLQKMFPKNGEDVPEIRFPGFTHAWEQRKLSELLFPADERNNAGKYTQDDVLAASLGTELVKKHIFFGLRSTEESVKNYRVVNSGDVIYTKSPIKGYPNGIIRTNKGLDGIVPSLYCVYHSIPSINSSIIQSYFEDKGRLDAYLYPLVNIGARNNVNITDLGFLEGTICISQDIDEQNKIVAFFNHLTNLITLHQRKVNHLQEQKKALLQQMFV
jgi:type I restriction enzyme, S subunit